MGSGVRELCELSNRDPDRGCVRGGTHYEISGLDDIRQDVSYREPIGAEVSFANVGFRCIMRLRRQ